MTATPQGIVLLLAALTIVITVWSLIRAWMSTKCALHWILASGATGALAAFGFESEVEYYSMAVVIALVACSFVLSAQLSRLSLRLKILTQENSLLSHRLQQLELRDSQEPPSSIHGETK